VAAFSPSALAVDDPVYNAFTSGGVAPGQPGSGIASNTGTSGPRGYGMETQGYSGAPIASPIRAGPIGGIGVGGAPVTAPAGGGVPSQTGTATATSPSGAPAGAAGAAAGQDAATTAAQAGNPATAAMPTPGELAAGAPLPYQAFGNIPSVNPTDVDTTEMPGALGEFEGMNQTALAPQFEAEDMALQDNVGGRGIVNSGAATYLGENLQQNQDATLAGADSPLVQAFAGYYNQGQETNAQEGTAASEFNANEYGNVVGGNETAYNNYLAGLTGAGEQYGNSLLSSYLGSYGSPNPSALATLGQAPGAIAGQYDTQLGTSGTATGAVNDIFNAFTGTGGTTSTPSYSSPQIIDPDNNTGNTVDPYDYSASAGGG